MSNARQALERIRAYFNEQVRYLSKEDFREVLEELGTDIDGHIEALDAEEGR